MNKKTNYTGKAGMLERAIERNRKALKPVLPFDLHRTIPAIFDLTAQNRELRRIDTSNAEAFTRYIFAEMQRQGTPLGVGQYNEDRVVYKHSELFAGEEENRSVHLGMDLFAQPGTPVSSPLPAKVHSFANNDSRGNYGPTIILAHCLDDVPFYTLYGHLSVKSLTGLFPGREITAGETIGWIGESFENGNWPPHLHFQVITDMEQWKGDFPGVAPLSEREKYLGLCPNPNLILGIPGR